MTSIEQQRHQGRMAWVTGVTTGTRDSECARELLAVAFPSGRRAVGLRSLPARRPRSDNASIVGTTRGIGVSRACRDASHRTDRSECESRRSPWVISLRTPVKAIASGGCGISKSGGEDSSRPDSRAGPSAVPTPPTDGPLELAISLEGQSRLPGMLKFD